MLQFLNELTSEQKSDLSKAVRIWLRRRRVVLLAVDAIQKGEASLGRRLRNYAGIDGGSDRSHDLVTEFGVESRIQDDDYLRGLESLRKAW